MRKLIPAAAILLLFMGTAHAQYTNNSGGNTGGNPLGMNMMPDNRRHLTPEEAQRAAGVHQGGRVGQELPPHQSVVELGRDARYLVGVGSVRCLGLGDSGRPAGVDDGSVTVPGGPAEVIFTTL
jgi:hypothetical protein